MDAIPLCNLGPVVAGSSYDNVSRLHQQVFAVEPDGDWVSSNALFSLARSPLCDGRINPRSNVGVIHIFGLTSTSEALVPGSCPVKYQCVRCSRQELAVTTPPSTL